MKRYAFARLLTAAFLLVGIAATAFVAEAAADDPPLVTIGSVSDPTETATVSGTAASDGQGDACLNGQHSGANPQDTSGAAAVNDHACEASDTAAGGAEGAPSSAGSSPGASTARSTRAGSGTTATPVRNTVTAANASGVVISRVRYLARASRSVLRLRVLVSVRDIRGRLVEDAIVFIRPLAGAKPTVAGPRATYTNRVGQARLDLTVTPRLLGRRLRFLVGARTPHAGVVRRASVVLGVAAAPARMTDREHLALAVVP